MAAASFAVDVLPRTEATKAAGLVDISTLDVTRTLHTQGGGAAG
jgi:hypothetical protein